MRARVPDLLVVVLDTIEHPHRRGVGVVVSTSSFIRAGQDLLGTMQLISALTRTQAIVGGLTL